MVGKKDDCQAAPAPSWLNLSGRAGSAFAARQRRFRLSGPSRGVIFIHSRPGQPLPAGAGRLPLTVLATLSADCCRSRCGVAVRSRLDAQAAHHSYSPFDVASVRSGAAAAQRRERECRGLAIHPAVIRCRLGLVMHPRAAMAQPLRINQYRCRQCLTVLPGPLWPWINQVIENQDILKLA